MNATDSIERRIAGYIVRRARKMGYPGASNAWRMHGRWYVVGAGAGMHTLDELREMRKLQDSQSVRYSCSHDAAGVRADIPPPIQTGDR